MGVHYLFELGLDFIWSLMRQVGRVNTVIADGVKEIWLSSEDTGAYGNL